MEKYTKDNIPTQTSWIHDLNAAEAISQCEAWDIPSKETLAENRELLKQFIKKSQSHASKSTTNNNTEQNTGVTVTGTEAPNVAQMLQQMHRESMQITMDAISQVVGALSASTQPSSSKIQQSIISELLREIRPNEGSNPARNVYFLMTIDSILESQPGHEHEIIPQILPYTRDQVRKFWQGLGTEKATWPEIVAKFRTKFFSIDDLRQMKEKFLYRAQRTNEDLEEYVANIRRAFKLLAPNTPTTEIFETVFLKISTETRTSLNSVGIIKTLDDLIQAAPRADTITKASKSQTAQLDRNNLPSQNPHYARNLGTTNQNRYSRTPFTPRSSYPNQFPRTFNGDHNQHASPSHARPSGYQPRQLAFTPGYYDNSSDVQNRRDHNKRTLNYRGRH